MRTWSLIYCQKYIAVLLVAIVMPISVRDLQLQHQCSLILLPGYSSGALGRGVDLNTNTCSSERRMTGQSLNVK